MLIPILISIKSYIKRIKDIKYISLIVFIITIILLSTIFSLLIIIDGDIEKIEMPTVYAISRICPNMQKIYGIIILISIFTTAISLGISFLKNTSKSKKSYNLNAIIICITSILFSQIGFSKLVNLLYPILGILGLLQIVQILLKNIAKITKN